MSLIPTNVVKNIEVLAHYLLLHQPLVLLSEPLPLGKLGVAQLAVAALLLSKRSQLLLLRHLCQSLLRCLTN